MIGIVTRIIKKKMFGFIKGEDSNDYFFHKMDFTGFYSDLESDVESGRKVKVEFEVVPSDKGLRAGDVRRLDEGV